MRKLAERLKEQRKINRKTQDDLARLLNTSRANYGYYEAGKQLPPIDKLSLMADYFNVSVDYLIGNAEEQTIDVLETIQHILIQLEQSNAVLNGKELTTTAAELISCSIENTLHTTKTIERMLLK